MRKSLFIPFFLGFIVSFSSLKIALAEDICSQKKLYLSFASFIRGLKKKSDVPCYVWGREKVKEHLVTALKEEYTDAKLEHEEFVYKTLGIIPSDYGYQKELIGLITSQLAGFYDQKKKFFVALEGDLGGSQAIVMVHELTHALQDQHFDVLNFIDPKKIHDDEVLARTALLEGDATAVMLDFSTMQLKSGKTVSQMEDVSWLMLQNVLGSFFSIEMSQAPKTLVANLLFPYTSGLRFVHNFLKGKSYSEVDKLFQRPPRSTEEILHFEKYLQEKADFQSFSDEEVLKEFGVAQQTVLYRNVVGEFMISALLQGQEIKNNVEVATGWGGDKVLLLEAEGKKKLLWLTAWDSEKDATEFFKAYSLVIEKNKDKNKFFSTAQIKQAQRYVKVEW